MFYKIILIGAGNLGSRHLQGLALVKFKLKIFVIDISNSNLKLAKERFELVNNKVKHEAVFENSINQISETSFEIAIIATSSNIRFKIAKNLLKLKTVKFLVLEKVLFQNLKEYDDFEIFSSNYNTKIFVNCARRLNSFYDKISKVDFGNKNIHMEVCGSSWSMGCNSIHFVDLFNFITNLFPDNWINNLDDKIIDSKRSGFIEFTGELVCEDKNGNKLRLISDKKLNSSLVIKISNDNIKYTIEEDSNKVIFQRQEFLENDKIKIDFQSKLTNKVVESLIEYKTCSLATYEVSSRLHKPLMKVMIDHFNKVNNTNFNYCPIT